MTIAHTRQIISPLLLLLYSSTSMAEEDSKVNSPPPPPPLPLPPFLEVKCKSLGKASRFAAGTKAGFAVSLINRKLLDGNGIPPVLYVEAVNDGEESISFGPDAVLVDYGDGWKLQTVTESDFCDGVRRPETDRQMPNVMRSSGSSQPAKTVAEPVISCSYVVKILFAFVLIFVLGAIFTMALENLPRLILFVNSFV